MRTLGFAFLILLTFLRHSEAKIVDAAAVLAPVNPAPWDDFIASSEPHPDQLGALLAQARPPKGLYVGVGAERVFLGAGQIPGITGILALDYKIDPMRFVDINSRLLRAAGARRGHYTELRLTAGEEEWPLTA